jgi:3-phosphoshikimate 1-carboxyvinyltransferase
MIQRVERSSGIRGEFTVPGDKSISHRALMLAALAGGESTIEGLGIAEDPQSTMRCLEALGVELECGAGTIEVFGNGPRGFKQAKGALDAGNSGTTLRLLTGILSGQSFPSVMTGDESLRKRPMKRVVEPLTQMGARIRSTMEGTAPLHIEPVEKLHAITYELPVASAQVKSAILLAGIYAEGTTTVIEAVPTRDHTERMLGLQSKQQDGKSLISIHGGMSIEPRTYVVPGDISSALFLVVAALIVSRSEIVLRNVGLNPTRTAALDLLKQMGGVITILEERTVAGEAIGEIRVRSSSLRTNLAIGAEDVPALIDELPILAIAAACAEGTFTVTGAAELRHKESDRIRTIVANLRSIGVAAEETTDGFIVHGRTDVRGGKVDSAGDHRIAMAFAVAGLRSQDGVVIEGAESAAVSFPGFWEVLARADVS